MYLKSLDIIGFKSFAERTRMSFEPGMTAIVGPNGCGKSNISDAIRWVLGEQRPTALRGGKMLDVIFNGTDQRKPLGLAEVSVTFAGCEQVLETEFNEVTITRRAYRSGESQFMINRSACRLRDIQRLFMGTGIGTTSYSFMAQGQIDAILSSRPEDRRTIFEEASGITKFKADRKEALRKLEQTETNLSRLSDVIREVKRQIGSLQRQAGKARRYQALREELRRLDVHATRRRLKDMEDHIRQGEKQLTAMEGEIEQSDGRISEAGKKQAVIQDSVLALEREIGCLNEAVSSARGRLESTRERLEINAQRIGEYRALTKREVREIEEGKEHIAVLEQQLAARDKALVQARENRSKAEADLAQSRRVFEAEQANLAQARGELQKMRDAAVERERLAARLQNQVAEIEARQREAVLRRERLAVEQAQLQRAMEATGTQREKLLADIARRENTVQRLSGHLSQQEAGLDTLAERQGRERDSLAGLNSAIAACRARHDLYRQQDKAGEGFPAGGQLLLDPANPLAIAPDRVMGQLAGLLRAPPRLRPALQAILRSWRDSLLVRDMETMRELLVLMAAQPGDKGAVRLLAARVDGDGNTPVEECPAGRPLLDELEIDPRFRDAARRLLGRVALVETPGELPPAIPPGWTFVTGNGEMMRSDGLGERWTSDASKADPLARQMAIHDLANELDKLSEQAGASKKRLDEIEKKRQDGRRELEATRRELEAERRQLAQTEGEFRGVERDAGRARQRLETVTIELETLLRQDEGETTRKRETDRQLAEVLAGREQLAESMAGQSDILRHAETVHGEVQGNLTEQRVRFAEADQQARQQALEQGATRDRIGETKRQVTARSESVERHAGRMEELRQENEELRRRTGEIEPEIERLSNQSRLIQGQRTEKRRELEQSESELDALRELREEKAAGKNRLELDLAECRMKRDNRLERMAETYDLTIDQLHREPEPEWPGEVPALEQVEGKIAELSSKIHEMGPVNLVAIEEHRELEERHTFLSAQQDDLVKARDQVVDLIRRINKKSAEMFRHTFDRANENFQFMFAKLFDGGSARLELLEEDVLESGIDIVARPPGKKLQSISLLSGGERTLTALSLLFAIYLVKPSPFCMLDELDAALDDSNIGRFINLLRQFVSQSQFVIVTHNHHTMTTSDIVYGVTMPEPGISRIMSMRLKQDGEREKPQEEKNAAN